MKRKYIPNILSLIRLLAVPAFLTNFFMSYNGHLIVALIIFIGAGLTDVVDGYLARRFGWVTEAGKILDPLADKLLQTAVLLALTIAKYIHIAIIIVFVMKELFTLIGSMLIYRKRAVITVSNVFGKLSTLSFYFSMAIVMLLCLLGVDGLAFGIPVTVLCVVTVAFAILAIVKYIDIYKKYLLKNEGK